MSLAEPDATPATRATRAAQPEPEPPARLSHIALVSGSVLVLELAFIREVPAEVRSISYFTNLMLMASFFGLGVGCMLQQRRKLDALFPRGLLLVAAFVYFARGLVVFDSAQSVHYWLSRRARRCTRSRQVLNATRHPSVCVTHKRR